MREMSSEEGWVDIEQVDAQLRVKKESAYRWIEARCLSAHKVGRLWKFRLSEIDVWVEADGAGEPEREGAVAKP